MQTMPPLLTAEEIAATMRVEASTVYRWGRSGVLPSVRIAGTVRFPMDAITVARESVHKPGGDK